MAKNIILSGVKSVTLLDDKKVTELDFCSQFLAAQSSLGENRAVASEKRAQNLNPMVEVKVVVGNAASQPDEFFLDFDIVCISETKTDDLIRIDLICRANNIKFFSFDLWGMFGYCFADLQEHEYAVEIMKHKVVSSTNGKDKTELVAVNTKETKNYPALEDAFKADLTVFTAARRLKRTGPGYLVLRILQQFRNEYGRDPLPASRAEDMQHLIRIRDDFGRDLVPDSAFTFVFAQISPAAAIVGGEVAHEIIKTVSQKEAPMHNLFIFDSERTCGYYELLEPAA